MRASWSLLVCLAAVVPAIATSSPSLKKRAMSSTDGTCGGEKGYTCEGSFFGQCCGPNGMCGSTADVCGAGCNNDFGYCSNPKGHVSHNGRCGGERGFTCKGSKFGDCCSEYGFCGSSPEYCSAGCRGDFGLCEDTVTKRSETTCPYENGTVYTDSEGYRYEINCDVNFSGGDMSGESFYAGSLAECMTRCSELDGCILATWVKGSPKGACYPKKSIGTEKSRDKVHCGKLIGKGPKPSALPTSTVVTSYSASTTVSTLPTATSDLCPSMNGTSYADSCGAVWKIECGIDHHGGDIHGGGQYVPGLAACINVCSSTEGCVDVSWVRGSPNGACYIKSSVGTAKANDRIFGAMLVSGCTASSSAPASTDASSSVPPPLEPSSMPLSTSASASASISNSANGTYTFGSQTITPSSSGVSATDVPPASSGSGGGNGASSGSPPPASSGGSGGGNGGSSGSPPPASSGAASSGSPPPASSGAASSGTPPPASSGAASSGSPPPASSGAASSGSPPPASSGAASSGSPPPASSGAASSGSPPPASSGGASSGSPPPASSIEGSATVTSSFASLSTIYSSPTASFSVPGNSSVIGSGTGSASASVSATKTHTAGQCSSTPQLTAGTIPGCIPCDGQPGTDKFCGYTQANDNYKVTPKTCNVVEYFFEITNTTLAPDGVERIVLLVNNQLPGPTVKASWGDTVVVHVKNSLQDNGTSIHWHGIRQFFTNQHDGVPSITQCPIASGDTQTYTWVATNYGTSWYHSHYAIQAWEGVFGPIVIDGPATASYDVDAGPVMLQDWTHVTVDSMYDMAQNATLIPNRTDGATFGGPRVMDTGLINGKNTWGVDGASNQTGSRFEMTFTPGQSYLLRLVNVAMQSTYKFYIDGHKFTVISMDFVPIVPYETTILNINIGQRYNIIVKADQPSGNYWMRSDNQGACAGTIQGKDIRGIIRYTDTPSPASLPTSTSYNYTEECIDEPYASLVPHAPMNAMPANQTEGAFDVIIRNNGANLYKWYLSGTTFLSQYSDPTLLGIYENGTAPTYSGNLLIEAPKAHEWIYVIIESPVPLPHPIHLHGHDFHILAEGAGSFTSDVVLNLQNPPRRDTALMPAAGFLVIAFETDNPGVWLMHCHIGWHTSMGFALQFVEMQDQIVDTISDSCGLEQTCKKWDTYAELSGITVHDSGV
ncbi:multicopper oxidase [Aulographum hederae CBS 113979]|uniref:Multicopper oxidase n=1 Tax=Aulographum hederae CBS 113979 TaxID=1176131 RepID=A0A6G1GVJ7_9PEZI|nr:multicopper oxidase [Aulographum hederae CBS 113979]